MTDKEKIKQEIERRFNDNMKASEQYTENSKSRALFTSAAKEDYDLLAFIESIPEEPVSEDLKKAAYKHHIEQKTNCFYDSFKAGAQWQKQRMMEDAVETTIVNDWQYGKDPAHAIIPAIHQRIKGFNVGDKVKLIIVKEE